MNPMPKLTIWTALGLLLVLSTAAGTRAWYLWECCDNGERAGAFLVQGPAPAELDRLIANIAEEHRFACKAPISDGEEPTAHVAPAYPLLRGLLNSSVDTPDLILRWLQVVLGTLTAGCYFFFARRAFHSTLIATLAGLLAAFHPFWIVNTAELNDGVLATFVVALALTLGARGGQTGGAVTGIFFGLALAAVALTRAALLPFAAIALLWFLWECRRHSLGWFAGFLALLGFVNGLAPWAIRNWQAFQNPVPVATSTYLHLWMGNNPQGLDSTVDNDKLKSALGEARFNELKAESNQAKRYNSLAQDTWLEARDQPAQTLTRRIESALDFYLGESWLKWRKFALVQDASDTVVEAPSWLGDNADTIFQGTMLGMGVLGLLGWRFSHAWRRYGRIGAIATLFIPLPYILSHAESWSGPRLPLDGMLLCFAAYALASFIPGLVSKPGALATKLPIA